MRRRTNKSAKVPNVKLRPAPSINNYSRGLPTQFWAEDSQAGSDDASTLDTCPRPFRGIVICATGIKDKPTLFKQAFELGATSVTAFTDRVTHLVAEDHGGAKYTCALELKIPIMKPAWIQESYQTWLRGDDVDMEETIRNHRLPIFSDVVLCLSGITDVPRRLEINKLVTRYGGTYSKNLERPVKVTHLLCSGDEETEKMRYAEKFNKRKEAVIHLVWEEWFWDSLEFGGRFDEAKYQVTRPRPERRSPPEPVVASSPPPTSAFPSEMDELPSAAAPIKKTKPINQVDQDDGEDETASMKLLPAVTLQIWGSLLNRRGYQVSGGGLVRTTSSPAVLGKVVDDTSGIGPGESVISAFRRANSFAPIKEEGPSVVRQPFRRTSTNSNAFVQAGTLLPQISESEKMGESSTSVVVADAGVGVLEPIAATSSGMDSGAAQHMMFAGCRFRALGEAKTTAVKNAVESYGGSMVTESDDEVDFVIVRLVSGSKIYRDEVDPVLKSKYRTECWLERCIFEDRICPPDQDISFLPLGIEIPIPNAEKIILSLSGFDQSKLCGIRRLLRALGVTLADSFSRRTTHLLCPSATGLKFEKAKEWGIPVINMSWLENMAMVGKVPGIQGHVVIGSHNGNDGKTEQYESMDVDMALDVKGKGKGKAKVTYQDSVFEVSSKIQMQDITNTDNSDPIKPIGVQPPPILNSRSSSSSTSTSTSSSLASLSFGKPRNELVGESVVRTRAPSIASIPPETLSMTSIQDLNLQPHQPLNESVTQASSLTSSSRPTSPTKSKLKSKQTWQQLEHERRTTQIPSSRTPSPMKIQIPAVPITRANSIVNNSVSGSGSGSGSFGGKSTSPVKIDHEVTKALQESITRALKRHTSEEEDVLVSGVGGANGLGNGRSTKRHRPGRNKALSSQLSEQKLKDVGEEDVESGEFGFGPITLMPFDLDVDGSEALIDVSRNSNLNSGTRRTTRSSKKLTNIEGGDSGQVEEESMRVMYEDPGQEDERKKLLNLLKGKSQSPREETKKNTVIESGMNRRRSGRATRK